MIQLKHYQEEAVDELLRKMKKQLLLDVRRKKIILKAPTGSGKTVITAALLERLTEDVAEDGGMPFHEIAYIWLAPHKLHEQSYFKMKGLFSSNQYLRTLRWDEIDHSLDYLRQGDILFLNWDSVNQDNNLIIRENELGSTLIEVAQRTQEERRTSIVVIVDEEHTYAGKTAKKAQELLAQLNPKIELRISATPTSQSDQIVTVDRQDVIAEEMIKKGVVLNPGIEDSASSSFTLNQQLLRKALAKRKELVEKYKAEGVDINPLLLIQLPSDKPSMSADDKTIKEELLAYLKMYEEITEENGRLAVWLSDQKVNLEGIEAWNSLVDVLLFKQAIAMGWDCPRAHVLLIFRDIKKPEFAVQTVGRILRMPQQRFYQDESLNKGFVYTNLSADTIQVVKEDMDYLSKFVARRKKDLRNVCLDAECVKRLTVRNRLGSNFRAVLCQTAEGRWDVKNPYEEDGGRFIEQIQQQNKEQVRGDIDLDKRRIMASIVRDMNLKEEEGVYEVTHKAHIARTQGEVDRLFMLFCRSEVGSFAPNDSTPVLANALVWMMQTYFGVTDADAKKIILHNSENRTQFKALIEAALENYKRLKEQQADIVKRESYEWEVPEERLYPQDTHQEVSAPDHALQPCFVLNRESTPEERFRTFLERHAEGIDWWYKNGDQGKEHFSVVYENSRKVVAPFYVDFVIRLKDGTICLFDTKTKDSDPEAVAKHNALVDYLKKERLEKRVKMIGGVIIGDKDGDLWRYASTHTEDTTHIEGWKVFKP